MNRRQLLAGLCAAALPRPLPSAEYPWAGVDLSSSPDTTVYNYVQIFRRTIEITRTEVICKLQPHNPPWREVKQPIWEINDLP